MWAPSSSVKVPTAPIQLVDVGARQSEDCSSANKQQESIPLMPINGDDHKLSVEGERRGVTRVEPVTPVSGDSPATECLRGDSPVRKCDPAVVQLSPQAEASLGLTTKSQRSSSKNSKFSGSHGSPRRFEQNEETADGGRPPAPKHNSWLEEKRESMRAEEEQANQQAQQNVPDGTLRGRIKALVYSSGFQTLTTILISVNGVIIGVETEHGDGSLVWTVIEMVFLICYSVELFLRIAADGLASFRDGWIRFDTSVLLLALIDLCILMPFENGGGEAKQLAMVLRITRLLKLARLIRLLRFFKELWLLVSSFGAAFKTLGWTMLLLVMVLYVFGILFVKMIGDMNPDEELQVLWGSLPAAMFTLFQIMTLEDWASIARALWHTEQNYMIFAILFVIMICTFAIMNTVMAVIVQHTLNEAMDQHEDMMKKAEEEFHRVADDLIDIFKDADIDKSGMLSKQEFIEALGNPGTRKLLESLDLGNDITCLDKEEIGILFDTIDIDNNHELHPQEFVDGMMAMRGTARSRSVFELHCDVQKKHKATHQLLRQLQLAQEQNHEQVRSVELAAAEEAESQAKSVAALGSKVDMLTSRLGDIAEALSIARSPLSS